MRHGLFLLALLVTVTWADEPAAEPELLLVQLRLNGHLLADFQDALATEDGRLWLPIEPLVQAAEGVLTSSSGDRFKIEMGTHLPVVHIDLAAQRLTLDDRAVGWPDDSLLMEAGQLMVTADLLAAWYDFSVALNDNRLSIDISSLRPLPADQRRLRARRWQRFGQEDFQSKLVYPALDAPYQLWGSPRGDLRASVNGGQGDNSLRSSLNAVMEVEAGYVSNRLFVSADGDEGLRSLRWTGGRTSPEGHAFGVPSLHRLEFGDVSSFPLPLQSSGGNGRGITFSTAPLNRPDLFDIVLVEGDALPGWDAELYRGSELIDFQVIGDDGRYRFDDVPLGFGSNQFRVVLYGPQGQVQERVQEQTIGGGQLLPGELHWRGSAVNTGTVMVPINHSNRLHGSQFNLRADYGVNRHLTTGLFVGVDRQAVERFRSLNRVRALDGNDQRLTIVNTGLSLRPVLGTTTTELILMHQDNGELAMQGNARLPIAALNVVARVEQYSAGFVSNQRLPSGQLIDQRLALRSGLNLGRLGSLAVDYTRLDLTAGGVRHEIEPSLRHRVAGITVTHDLKWIQQGSRQTSQYRLLASQRRGNLTSRAQFQASGSGLDRLSANSVNASADYRWSGQRSAGLSGSYAFASKGYSLGARLSQRLGVGEVSVSTSIASDGQWAAGLTYAIGLGRNGQEPISFMPQGSASGGAVMVRLFEDVTGNGQFDSEVDWPISDAGVLLDGRPMPQRSDDDGWLVVTGLSTTRTSRIALDRDSLNDPFLTAAQSRAELQGRPGHTHQLNMALQDGGFVSGRVQRFGRAAAGIEVVAERVDGLSRKSTFSLSDGYFAFESLAPGAWQLTVADDILPDGWSSTTVSVDVVAGGDDEVALEILAPTAEAVP